MVSSGKEMSVCIIPARGGSKRIPGKNIKDFCGFPVISNAINAAITCGCFERVIVSTDSIDIAEVAKKFGAEVPFIRPENLSDDFAGTIPVVQHAIGYLFDSGIEPEYTCCIYPVTPLLKSNHLLDSFNLFKESGFEFCMPVAEYRSPIQRAYKITDNCLSMINADKFKVRTQDLEKSFYDVGQFYWGMTSSFINFRGSFSGVTLPYIVKPYDFIDVDTIEDWHMAEILYKNRKF